MFWPLARAPGPGSRAPGPGPGLRARTPGPRPGAQGPGPGGALVPGPMISSSLRRSAREVVIRSYSYPRSLLQNAASGPGPWPGPGRPGAQRPARWVLQNTRREVGIGSGYKTVGVCCGHTTIANDLRHHLRFRSRLAASMIAFCPKYNRVLRMVNAVGGRGPTQYIGQLPGQDPCPQWHNVLAMAIRTLGPRV